nr:MAG TPA: hypothetical protein [Caudoviricetes sp.]
MYVEWTIRPYLSKVLLRMVLRGSQGYFYIKWRP